MTTNIKKVAAPPVDVHVVPTTVRPPRWRSRPRSDGRYLRRIELGALLRDLLFVLVPDGDAVAHRAACACTILTTWRTRRARPTTVEDAGPGPPSTWATPRSRATTEHRGRSGERRQQHRRPPQLGQPARLRVGASWFRLAPRWEGRIRVRHALPLRRDRRPPTLNRQAVVDAHGGYPIECGLNH